MGSSHIEFEGVLNGHEIRFSVGIEKSSKGTSIDPLNLKVDNTSVIDKGKIRGFFDKYGSLAINKNEEQQMINDANEEIGTYDKKSDGKDGVNETIDELL
jgi:hypothetical protein